MRLLSLLAFLAALASGGCQAKKESDHAAHAEETESWAVTAWGDRYEIFAEADPLVAGAISKSHTHVTLIDGFASLNEGAVEAVLRNSGGEEVFRQEKALRNGIFSIEIRPAGTGTFSLFFRVEGAAGPEEIPAGRVRVGSAKAPGGLVEPPRYGPPGRADHGHADHGHSDHGHAHHDHADHDVTGEAVSFLKEQQWRTSFGTAWAEIGAVHRSATGPGLVRPAAGGEAILSAPLDGIVSESLRTYMGMEVDRGTVVAHLRPRVTSDRSITEIRSDLDLAQSRLERLEELAGLEAVSRSDVETGRALVRTLTAEAKALTGEGPTVDVRSPFRARIAEVMVVPGQAVTAGTPLARIVRDEPLWIEVALRPLDAATLGKGLAGMVLKPAGEAAALTFGAEDIRLVSSAPEVSASTGSVQATFEIRNAGALRPGQAVDAEVLLPDEVPGIVLPVSALVDDGGVPVVYVQIDGESFARLEVKVVAVQGDRILVEGPPEWSRVVTTGAAAIRRAALLQTGPPEGHVH